MEASRISPAGAATDVAITCGLLLGVRIALFPLVGLNAALAHGLATVLRIIATCANWLTAWCGWEWADRSRCATRSRSMT